MLQASEFLPLITPHAPGVPAFVAEHCLRLAAMEFCERSRCWRYITKATTNAKGFAYMVAPSHAAIHEIEWASFDGERLAPMQHSDIDHGATTEENTGGQPEFITQSTHDTVQVYPFAAGEVKLSLFLKPRHGHQFGFNPENPLEDDLNQVPDFLFVQHAEPIAHGALGRILGIPGERFTDANASLFYRDKFNTYCDSQFSMNMRGQQRAPRRSRYVDF